MATEAICSRRAGGDYGGGHVPPVARETAHRRMVSQHGHVRLNWIVFRHGYLPTYLVLCNGVYGQTWNMALSKPIRGRGILRQFSPCVGLAGGSFPASPPFPPCKTKS